VCRCLLAPYKVSPYSPEPPDQSSTSSLGAIHRLLVPTITWHLVFRAALVLESFVKQKVANVELDFFDFTDKPIYAPVYVPVQSWSCPDLLSAVYLQFYLWMIRAWPVHICENKRCSTPFPATRTGKGTAPTPVAQRLATTIDTNPDANHSNTRRYLMYSGSPLEREGVLVKRGSWTQQHGPIIRDNSNCRSPRFANCLLTPTYHYRVLRLVYRFGRLAEVRFDANPTPTRSEQHRIQPFGSSRLHVRRDVRVGVQGL
jgi:hypothetical protein